MEPPFINNPKRGFWSLLKLHVDAWLDELHCAGTLARLQAQERIAEQESRVLEARNALERAKAGRDAPPISFYAFPDEED